MTNHLDLHDIQGNVVRAYAPFGFPKARYVFLTVLDSDAGRRLLLKLNPLITTSAPWSSTGSATDGRRRPSVTTNIAFTFEGLRSVGVPQASLQSFPDEFAMGMRERQDILGDDEGSSPENWDPVWQQKQPVHLFISINGANDEVLEARYQEILGFMDSGVVIASGHRTSGRDDLDYQPASALFRNGQPTAKEHFGYTDGISNPFFKGSGTHPSNVIGGGKPTGGDPETMEGWEPLETGEFLLGHKDEAQEEAPGPAPTGLGHNGTFLVYRKLHQNVASFDSYLKHVGQEYLDGEEALAAKLAGRWRSGAPITSFPTEAEATAFGAKWLQAKVAIHAATDKEKRQQAKVLFSKLNARFTAFDYNSDKGSRCPLGAHLRRANPRGSLEFGEKDAFETPGALTNRRRILRRGLPYGDSSGERIDDGDHGIIFMAVSASIRRQFEFVQQQWMNYGNDFRLANQKDPVIGNQGAQGQGGDGRMVIPGPDDSTAPPFFCNRLPRFVTTRGGGYFFVPSLTALQMIGHGRIDPT